jgi:hypothetical protein
VRHPVVAGRLGSGSVAALTASNRWTPSPKTCLRRKRNPAGRAGPSPAPLASPSRFLAQQDAKPLAGLGRPRRLASPGRSPELLGQAGPAIIPPRNRQSVPTSTLGLLPDESLRSFKRNGQVLLNHKSALKGNSLPGAQHPKFASTPIIGKAIARGCWNCQSPLEWQFTTCGVDA